MSQEANPFASPQPADSAEPQPLTCPNCDKQIGLLREMIGKTVVCPHCGDSFVVATAIAEHGQMSGREVYNVVSDVGTGVNVRLIDNLIQLLVIVVCTFLGAGVGFFVITDHLAGALVGGFIGLLVGLFGSGLFLMIYRAIRHVTGHHK